MAEGEDKAPNAVMGTGAETELGLREVNSADGLLDGGSTRQFRDTTVIEAEEQHEVEHTVYKVYKRRWFGLVQLALLNIIVSWDVSTSTAGRLLENMLTLTIVADLCGAE